MLRKEILIICLLLCIICSVQAVSAADIDANGTDGIALTAQDIDVVEQSNDLSTYSLPEDTKLLADGIDDEGSFSDLNNLIAGEDTVINLEKNYTFNDVTDTDFADGISITKSITINGNGHAINGNNQARIFNLALNPTLNIVLNNITFINGHSTSNGGAINVENVGSLQINDCTFSDNDALTQGGAINVADMESGSITIASSSFKNNKVTDSKGSGGAIYINNDDCVIEGCEFIDNNANGDGGTVFIAGDYCKIYNSTFNDNIAGDDGGAIYWEGSHGIIYNVTATNNKGISAGTSNTNGGTIIITGDDMSIDLLTVIEGSAGVNGGGMFVTGNNINITNSIFSDCSAVEGSGGALYIIGNHTNMVNITVDGATGSDGAAIYIDGDYCTLSNSSISNNVADDDGAIYWEGNHGIIYNVTATNNKGISAGSSNSNGGAFIITGSDMSIDLLTVTECSAGVNGGGMFVTGNYVNITNSVFNDCSAVTGSGGALYVIGNHTNMVNITVDGATGSDGAAIYIDGNYCNISDSSISNGIADDDGGAIYWNGSHGKIYNLTCSNNYGISAGSSSSNGGAICLTGNNVTISHSSFIGSNALVAGGTIFVTGNNVNITDSSFGDTYVSDSISKTGKEYVNGGGAIYVLGTYTYIDNCTFKNAHAREGGAIYVQGANAKVHNCSSTESYALNGGSIYIKGDNAVVSNFTLDDSYATVAGGAIYIEGVYASVINSTFESTSARISQNNYGNTNLGGALYIKGNYASVLKSQFNSSSAYQGGAIYLAGNYCNVTNSSVNGGYAYIDGGALYSTGSYSNVYYSNFTSNEARGDGGAMYWFGGKNSIKNTIVGCIFLENVAYANSNSNTKGGGAIYWSEGGYNGTIKNSQFINNSVQSTVKADGGAILWDKCHYALIDNCIFDGDFVTTTNTGDVWVQGGAIYLRVEDPYTIINSKFINCYSEKEAGALYVQSNSDRHKILIVNTTFINNVAQSIGKNSNGGGAVQVKQSDITIFQNVTFINNTANQGGAVTVLETKSNITFIDCTFDNNTANNGNGGSIWANKKFFIYNTTIANSTASNYGGGLYTNTDMAYDNLTFINNTATSGGALYWNKAGIKIQNMKFINNTAIDKGGAIYITAGAATIQNVNMTGNKAFIGSAIWADKDVTLVDVYLMKNQANSSSLNINFDESNGNIVVLFKGKDKYLNAIYLNGGTKLYCTNVTYWDESGETNSGSSKITWPTTTAQDTPEGGQNLTVRVYGGDGKLVEQDILTDNNGKVYLNLADIISDTNYHEMYVESELNDDTYYTIIKATTRSASQVNASANKTPYHSNSTLNVNVTQGATGNVSVYIGDTFIANITLDNSKGSINMSTLVEGVYLPVGNHTLSFVYNGNVKYDKSNTTAILEITKITPVMLLNVTGIGYNLLVNVTVMDAEYNITDATGNVTIQVDDRTATIYLGNGQGMTIIYGLPIGNYTVNATYHGDNNYYNITNSTEANVTEKTQTVLVLDVDSEKLYYINETVPIKVTILPKGEGNITLYINGIPHELTLQTVNNSTFVEFNATELKDGINYVFATYGGTEIYAPSWAQDKFNVSKYNSTIGIETANITFKDTEIINITLPDDAEGIIKVLINDTPYLVELVGGSAQVNVSDLAVGTYNVTVIFNGDKKYYNSTNSTLFNVTKIKPAIEIDVGNVTYGNETVIVVILPEGVTGNVTIKVNDRILVYGEQEIVDGKVTLPGTILPAGNYTVEATYNGDGNYSVSTAQTNFTVYRQAPVLTVTVEDINYGENANITVTVPDGVTGTIIIKVNGTESEPLTITEGKVNLTVAGLAVGNYPVEVIYSGNDNYSNDTVTTAFDVFQIGTELDVDVHDITVWGTEYINITIKDGAGQIITNATGNVTININGVNHTAEIKDGIARFNTSDLTVGHKVVWAFYDGDRNLTGNRSMVEFDVGQRAPIVNVTAQNITVGVTENITITIPANATGFVIVSGNFTKHPIYVDEFTNGVAVIPIDDLAVGNYSVHIKYYGDALDNYTTAENDTVFRVDKINATVTIDVDDINYTETAVITVTVPAGVEGNITIRLNDTARTNITKTIVDGKAVFEIPDLAAGNYTVNVTYNGNDDYNINNTESGEFEVRQIAPGVEIISVISTVDDNATVIVKVDPRVTENVTVTIVGIDKNYTASVGEDGYAVITTDKLDYGTYTVVASYPGDKNFTVGSDTYEFTTNKTSDYLINITASDINVGNNTNITVRVPSDATGKVIIELNGTNYTAVINGDGIAVLNNISTLKEGIYNVTAYFGNDKYVNKTVETRFVVSKVDVPIRVDIDDSIYVGDTVSINVTLESDATGNVTIEINGETYNPVSFVDGVARFEVPNVTYGNKTVAVTYSGNDKYVSNFTTANFTVNKRTPSIVVDTDGPIGVGDNITISVDVPANATGYVVVSVNGTNYTINITNGDYSVVVPDLGEGTWNVTATYVGDDQYLPNTNKTSFVVNKVESTIVIDVDSIDYGNKVNITVTVKPDATGYITIRINETRNITLPIADGKVNWIVEGLAADNYTVYANYSGDDKYNENRTDKPFEVRQISPEIEIIEVISTADDNATIIVKVDPRVTENVTVTVEGKPYSKAVDENGIAVITTDKLDYGTYTIVASYPGDKNFTIDSDTYEFTTNATDDYLINIAATDIKVGNNTNITVRVPGDATGNVIIELNGTNYTAVINEDGIAVLNNISTLKEGVYNVTAYFGNDKYANKSVETRFEVSKVDTPISITVINDTSIYVGDTVKVIVTVPGDVTENVTIEINGKTFSNTTVDGNATFYVPNITYGNKTVVTAYVGDDKYRYNSTTANFTVNKRESYVNVNVTDGKVGGVAVVNVTVPANATGYVIVNVDGQDYAINLTDGVGSVEIRGLANGTYDVTATYLGDDQYLSSINDTQVVKVDKVTPNINITVSEDGIIANGSDVDITVKVPVDATGKVNITLSNGTSYIVPVIDGEAKLHLEAPDIGVYDITAEYLGDDKYTKQQNESSFEVYDNSREVIIIAPDTFVNVNNTVSVILVGAHEGEVTIIISNASGVIVKENATLSTASAEGIELSTASLTLPLLEAGKYNVSAYYIEHDGTKVILHEGNNNFTVSKLSSEIKIKEIRNITVGENATIELEIELDARANDGNISVIVDGKEYITNTTTLKVTVSNLGAGNYTVEAFYQGNRWYNESNATSSFEVTKNIAPISISVTNSNVGEVEQINVTLPENATGYVIVNVDGQEYHANVTKGLAQVNITGLKAGKHNVTAIYVETDGYFGNVTNTTLTVSKLNSTITVKVDNITVGDVAAVNITVITGATGNVTITIGDEYNKTVGVTDGVISVIVPDLTVGEKTVNVTYNGNEKYLPSSNSTDFTVGQTAAEINIVVENITYGGIESIIAFINATGNVTIKLNGDELDTVDITDGKVVYDIEGLNAGNYTVELVYNGNVNTNSTSVETNFTVAKADPKITIEVEDIIYGDVEHIVVHVNAEGNVTIKVINVGEVTELTLENGRAVLMASRWTVPQYDGQASVDVKDLEVGNYPVEVTYNGNENYNAATLTADFDVLKANTTVSIEADSSLKVNETQVMNITINNTNATGNAIVILDGKNYTVPVTNGTANFTTPKLGYGNHSVVVIYEGDKNLNGNWTLATFTVEKLKSELTINVSDINVGDKQTITVNVTDGATGFVVISVDGKDYYVPIDQGKATLELENLTNKTYSVHAKYLGDDYYDVSENDTEFNVNKVNSTVSVKVENIAVGDKAVITITVPEDATGNVTTVIVNGETYTVPVVNGTGTLVVPDLGVGNYTVEVTYNGDGKYLPNNNVTTFEVSKVNTTSGDIKVVDQGNGTVVVVVGDNATGNVTIKVGNNTYNATVVNGTAVVTLNNETPGTHDIKVIYSGDDTHEGANTTAVVNIPKYDTPINITVTDIDVGDKATIVVSVPENATGNITIEIEGQKYTQPIVDGNATFEIENLTDGAKTIVAIYDGDYNYTNNFTTANFTVNKVTPVITVNATDVTVGDKTLIEVTAPDDITGPVLVDVDGVGYYVNITDGKGSIEVPITKEGTYNVTARYVGDDKYTNASANNTFKASKVTDTPINVTVENATVGDKAVITVDVPKDATGNVTITVDGKNYTVPVANGTATLVVDDLKAGNYTVNVTYNGDDKYAPANETAKLEISKKPVDLQVIDQGNGTITVVVGDNATGNVTVKVGNETYTAEVINGTAVITLENNTPGTYDVEAIYSGDDAHESSAANATATIPKLETPMSVTVENIKVGDKETIVVSLPSDAKGNVTIEINGVKYTEEIKDGNATFTIENLTYGNKTVYVDYVGDNNYTGNHTSANFTVEKRTPTVEVEVSPINVGETAEIKVTVPSNATGYVIVEIDNQTYAGEVKDGVATVKVKGLASGDVPINVTYLGDDQYDSANATSSVKVSKVPSTINVTADNITVGDKAVIKVEVPKDLCGNVTVTVDGKNYTVFVSGGEGTLVIPDLEAGDYTVDAIFDGCKKYEPSDATTKFTVSKKPTDIEVIDQNNGTVTVIVGDNATGNVTTKVGNETYNATVVNGTATITLENTTPGTHDIEVIYSGDDTHEGSTVNSTVTIPKVETPISVDVDDIKVGETATIVVNVPEDATGNVTIEIDGVKYTEDIKDGKATFNIDNLTVGTKTIAVEYAGDDTYLGNHTTANITVSKVPSTVKVEIEDSNVGDNVTVKVTVPEDATGQVLIDIDGVGYYVNVTDGTGTIEIPRIPSGEYPVNVTYAGDDKYLPSSNSISFNVSKVPSFVIPTAQDIWVGDNENIKLVVPSDATGTVTVVIDGEEYNFDLDDTLGAQQGQGDKYSVAVSGGNGVLVISGLPKGEYVVSVRYNGDAKYLPSVNETTFAVSKKSTDMDVIDQGNGTVVVKLPENATGNVTIKVGNETYTAEVVNGTAVITLENATPGTHDIEVKYSGDDTYASKTVDSTVTIPKYDTPISVEVEDIGVGDTAVITVTVPEDATGTVTIEINGKEYTAEIENGKAVFNVDGLTAGDKTVAVKYPGDKNYVENFTTGNFAVSKVPSTVKATSKDIKVGKDEVITVTVPSDATGRVLVDIDGVGYYADIVNGKAKVIVPELPSGKYKATVTYEGDDKYLPSKTTTSFTVTKVKTPISATGDEIEQGQEATVVVKLPEDATGTVTITVDGKKYTAEVENGKAVFSIPGLTKGDHDVTAVYSGDKKYEANDTITDIEVHYRESPGPNPDGDDVSHDGIDLSVHQTSNPILILLLVLLALGSTQLRRFKK